VAGKVTEFLKSYNGKDLPDFDKALAGVNKLETAYNSYKKETNPARVDDANKRQRKLNEAVHPFFTALHELLKEVDKKVRHIEKEQKTGKDLKTLKTELEDLHKKVKETEYYFLHVSWLQERFPEAKYEDVTGLCKLAGMDEVKEQEYSLNPGRYVGVVIEEDGKTEEEFIQEMLSMNDKLMKLNADAKKLESVITHNIRQIAGE